MVVSSFRLPLLILVREVSVRLIPIALYVFVISWLDLQYHLENLHFPPTIVAVVGTVIALLLAFRTNAAYARWWEARTLWGAIVNDSRSWVRQLLGFCRPADDQRLQRLAYRQVAWCYALTRSLRKQQPTQDLKQLLDTQEIDSLSACQNVPNELLLQQAKELRELFEQQRIELFQFVEMERTLVRLTNSMGGCERIRNTPFPLSYGRMVDLSVYVFAIFLPFGLVGVPTAGLVTTSLTLSFAFLMIERVAIYLQDPFENQPSDTPMLSLSRTIEINIRQMLRESELPEKIQPEGGILY